MLILVLVLLLVLVLVLVLACPVLVNITGLRVRALNAGTQHSPEENENSSTKVSLELFKALVDVRGAPLPPPAVTSRCRYV